MKNLLAFVSALFLASAGVAQTTETIKITVTDNPNLTVQDPVATIIAFSANGVDGLDNGDMGSIYSHNSPGTYALPFTMSTTNDVITYYDSRPDLDRYKTIDLGFTTKDSATIKVHFTSSSSNPADSTYRPAYLYLERIATGEMYEVLEDTVKLHIDANENFQVDFRLHIGPAIQTLPYDESCYGSLDGSMKVVNPNTNNWQLYIYDDMLNLLLTAPVANPDTLIPDMGAGLYTVVTRVGNITLDSVEAKIESPAPVVPSFEIDNYYPTTNDFVNFANVSTGTTTYSWTFGDGGTDTLENVSHQYTSPGAYEIVMVATNEFGCTESVYDSVWVSAATMQSPLNSSNNLNFRTNTSTSTTYDPSARKGEITVAAGAQKVIVRNSGEENAIINVLNVNGQLISTVQSNDQLTELAVPRGAYLVQVVSSNGEAQTTTVFVNE